MDIKSKNYKRRRVIHGIGVVILAAMAVGILLSAYYINLQRIDDDLLFRSNYKDSGEFAWNYVIDPIRAIGEAATSETETPESALESLGLAEGILFYYEDADAVLTNSSETSRDFFAQHPNAFFAYENGRWSAGATTSVEYSYALPNFDPSATFYFAVDDSVIGPKQVAWSDMRNKVMPYAIGILVQLALGLILFIYLLVTTGRVRGSREVQLNWLDHIYLEVFVAVFIAAYGIWGLAAEASLDGFSYSNGIIVSGQMTTNDIYMMMALGFFGFTFVIMTMVALMSIVRRLKARIFIKQSISYRIAYRIWDFFKSFFDGRHVESYPLTKVLFQRQKWFIIGSAGLVFLTFLFLMAPPLLLIPPILEGVLIYWYIKYNNETYEAINQGFNESLEDQMKAERMKIALVTNVSHDLKTPLTSIISYAELLSREEGLSESARDYVSILSEKSNRLKNIVSDLFDLAKSTSGNLPLEMENIDLKKLVEQTLADMEDDISKTTLKFKVELPETPMIIHSDGKKLYRVLQNLLDNTLKYALPDTRVFVSLKQSGSKAVVEIKNIAAYEMNFSEDEILQRFTRGDEARSTDGSGLGLSIAESFTQACGGNFILHIDGDLFKVLLSFKLESKEPIEDEVMTLEQ